MSEEIRINPITDALRERPTLPNYPTTSKESAAKQESAKDSKAAQVDMDSTQRAVKKLNSALIGADTSLRFRVDNEAEMLVVSIIDDASGEVISQMPAEDVVEAAKRLSHGEVHTLQVTA